MPFETDPQTLQDLSLTGINGQTAILDLFKPVTIGGAVKLKEYFDHPLTNIETIRERLAAIQYFADSDLHISLHKEEADFISFYIDQAGRALTVSKIRAYNDQFRNWIKPSNQRYVITRGVRLLFKLIKKVSVSFEKHQHEIPGLLKDLREQTDELMESLPADLLYDNEPGVLATDRLDHIFRSAKIGQVRRFLDLLYVADVLSTTAITAINFNFCYPGFITADHPELKLKGFAHPFIKTPVRNDIEFTYGKNLCFITGANMAGKSTVLKSIGICAYLAHMGFPVPAESMQTTVFNGLFTTINLADDIALGHSHFYREVLRIKQVATKVGTVKNLLVIFDELFRGTNVKDAYDASLVIIKAFAEVNSSVFMISTHIVEVADELKEADNIFFNCLSTEMVQDKACYTYKLKPGISNERLGMRIIEDEGLVDLIKSLSNQ